MNKQLWEPKAEVFGCMWQRSGSPISLFPVSFLLTDISLYLWTVFVLRNCLITICKLKEGWLKWIRETRFCVLFLLLTLFFVSIYLFIYIILFLIFFGMKCCQSLTFFSNKGFCLQNRLIIKSPFLCCVSFFLSQIGTSLKKTRTIWSHHNVWYIMRVYLIPIEWPGCLSAEGWLFSYTDNG